MIKFSFNTGKKSKSKTRPNAIEKGKSSNGSKKIANVFKETKLEEEYINSEFTHTEDESLSVYETGADKKKKRLILVPDDSNDFRKKHLISNHLKENEKELKLTKSSGKLKYGLNLMNNESSKNNNINNNNELDNLNENNNNNNNENENENERSKNTPLINLRKGLLDTENDDKSEKEEKLFDTVPIEDFGAAIMRGMGYETDSESENDSDNENSNNRKENKNNAKREKKQLDNVESIIKPHPAMLGLGASQNDLKIQAEIHGTSNSKYLSKNKIYTPLTRK